jgi:hypothetical protein
MANSAVVSPLVSAGARRSERGAMGRSPDTPSATARSRSSQNAPASG